MDEIKRLIEKVCEWLEIFLSFAIVAVIIVSVCFQVSNLIMDPLSLEDGDMFLDILENILNFVVGVELIKMLVRHAMSDVLEVLILATARHMVVSHSSGWVYLIQIAGIAMLFAVRKYLLIPHYDPATLRDGEGIGQEAKKAIEGDRF